MNLDAICSTSSSARPAAVARRRRGGRGAGLRRLRAGLPGARRHPGAAGRRGTQADDLHRMAASRDLRRRPPRRRGGARSRRRAPALPRRGRCAGTPRGGRPRRTRSPRRWRRSPTAGRGRWSPPARTPGCCARCSSRSARCRSSPGPDRASPAGPAASTWSSCSRPRAVTRPPPPPCRGGPPRLPAGRRCSRASLVAEHARAATRRVLPTADRRPARHRRRRARPARPGRPRARTDPEVVADALDEVAVLRPAPRHRGQPGQEPRHRHRRLQADALGRLRAGRARRPPGRRVDPPGHRARRARGRCRAPAARARGDRAATCSPTRSPTAARAPPGAGDPRRRHVRGGRPRVAGPAHGRPHAQGVRVETITTEADGARGPLRGPALHRPVRRDLPADRPRLSAEPPGGPVASRHGYRGWHQGRRGGAAGQHRHRGHQVRRVLAHRRLVDAGRGDPLGRRLRQPGLLLLGGRQARKEPPRSTRSATAASATSTRSSWPSCCSASAACSRCTRRTTSSTRSTRATEASRSEVAGGGSRSWCSSWRSDGEPLVPHRDRRDQQDPGDASFVQFIRRAKQPELPVILLEDFAALIGLVFALVAVWRHADHGQRVLGRRRHGPDRVLLVAVAVVLGIETKSLLLGEAATRGRSCTSARRSRDRGHRAASSTCGPCTSDPRSCSWP